MLKQAAQVIQGYRPVVVGAFVLDALIAVKHVFASFGLALTEPQADAIMAAVALGVAFVVQTYTSSNKYLEAKTSVEARAREFAAKANVPDDAPPDDDLGVSKGTLDKLRRMLDATWKRADAAERAGNYTAAQRYGRDAAYLANTIARKEKGE